MNESKHILLLFQKIYKEADQNALLELHNFYFHKLFRFVLAITRSRESTEEIVNDVFIRIWQKRELFEHVNSPEAYLFTCAKNLALKQLKRKALFTENLDDFKDFELSVERNPEDIFISSEMLRHINNILQQLPPKSKLIFQLVKENNLKYKEVAKILGISQKTVENQMSIVFKKISRSIPLSYHLR